MFLIFCVYIFPIFDWWILLLLDKNENVKIDDINRIDSLNISNWFIFKWFFNYLLVELPCQRLLCLPRRTRTLPRIQNLPWFGRNNIEIENIEDFWILCQTKLANGSKKNSRSKYTNVILCLLILKCFASQYVPGESGEKWSDDEIEAIREKVLVLVRVARIPENHTDPEP